MDEKQQHIHPVDQPDERNRKYDRRSVLSQGLDSQRIDDVSARERARRSAELQNLYDTPASVDLLVSNPLNGPDYRNRPYSEERRRNTAQNSLRDEARAQRSARRRRQAEEEEARRAELQRQEFERRQAERQWRIYDQTEEDAELAQRQAQRAEGRGRQIDRAGEELLDNLYGEEAASGRRKTAEDAGERGSFGWTTIKSQRGDGRRAEAAARAAQERRRAERAAGREQKPYDGLMAQPRSDEVRRYDRQRYAAGGERNAEKSPSRRIARDASRALSQSLGDGRSRMIPREDVRRPASERADARAMLGTRGVRSASDPRKARSSGCNASDSDRSLQPRRSRWELKLVGAVTVVLIAVLGVGVFIADGKAKETNEAAAAYSQPDVQAAQPVQAEATASSSAASAKTQALADRAKEFAVDPQRTDWNYEENGRKTVYLTIDDGPSEMTSQVLDILDKYDAHATFFVTGHSDASFPLIKEAFDRGHTIGMHTYSHDYDYVYSSVDAYFDDLSQISDIVSEQIGFVPCFIRFPGGSSNEISQSISPGIMEELIAAVQERGYQYYDWNMSVGDGSEHTTEEIIGYATEPTDLQNIMLLCHDSALKQTTIDALPAIIEHYQSLGYTFEAIDRNSKVFHHF